jgi:hydroxyacylglutathione hydrolase
MLKKSNFVNLSVQLEEQAIRALLTQAQQKPGYFGSIHILPLPAFQDNYIWALFNHQDCVVVDPGDAQVVIDFVTRFELTLTSVLITHHHPDHTGGLKTLLEFNPDLTIFGPHSPKIPLITHPVGQGDTLFLNEFGAEFAVIEAPGHTLDHILYYADDVLFCGDTLFSIGCGRIFEGSHAQMHNSLQTIMKLPANTQIYCTHEYTLANIDFALTIEPLNPQLLDYQKWAERQRSSNIPTIPTTLSQQLAMNPFLRVKFPQVVAFAQRRIGQQKLDHHEVFAQIRLAKDEF